MQKSFKYRDLNRSHRAIIISRSLHLWQWVYRLGSPSESHRKAKCPGHDALVFPDSARTTEASTSHLISSSPAARPPDRQIPNVTDQRTRASPDIDACVQLPHRAIASDARPTSHLPRNLHLVTSGQAVRDRQPTAHCPLPSPSVALLFWGRSIDCGLGF